MVNQTTPASRFPVLSASKVLSRLRRLLPASISVCICLPTLVGAQQAALPQGGSVASGDVSIAQPGPQTMTITQGSDRAIVNWNSFSIGAGASVDIRQPSSTSAILNRVTGATTSQIYGRLAANGQVHLVNPNGIFIGPNGTVNAGSFSASTLGISDEDFNAGRLRYEGLGDSATVENAGRVTIGRGGYASLIGGKVRNSGIVTVPYGQIGFAAGERVVLDVSGDQFLQVALPSDGADDGEALIENTGIARANGGTIEMRAATARNAARNAINLSGVAEASSVSVRGGTIVLGGGQGGTVRVSGKIATRARPQPAGIVVAQSSRPPVKGGNVIITGARIALDGAQINASGADGGGTIRIGGDFAGQGILPRAETVLADARTLIKSDALQAGDGGRIVVWSDVYTEFAGNLSARGGECGGNGGFVEISSKQTLNYTGLADRRAPLGSWGVLLLDPTDITINPGAGGEDMLEANLAAGPAILNSGGADPGDITINADINWSAATTLTLIADNEETTSGMGGNIVLNGAILGVNGALELDAINQITTGPGGDVDIASFTLQQGNWVQNTALLPSFSALNFTLLPSASFTRFAGGTGADNDPFRLIDIYGLQGIATDPVTGGSGSYQLVDNIEGRVTSDWINGFQPIDIFDSTIRLDGAGFTISNVSSSPDSGEGPNVFGLFRNLERDSVVSNLTLENFVMSGASGGLLAASSDGTIRNVRATGIVTGPGGVVGGLVGENRGLIEDSVVDVEVTVTADFNSGSDDRILVGGFVGYNNEGLIRRSHALGSISVTDSSFGLDISAGGFVGLEYSPPFDPDSDDVLGINFISDSYARGNVSVNSTSEEISAVNAGGFVGTVSGPILQSYSTGSVTTSGNANFNIGGFAGANPTGSSQGATNFWDIQTSGIATSEIGTGLTTAQFQNTETFISLAEPQGFDFDNVWAPGDTGFYPVNYTTSAVILAKPDALSLTYGGTPTATATGTVNGGPEFFVFGEDTDTLDTDPAFQSLSFASQNVGTTTFTLDTASITSANGIVYRVVDRPGNAEIAPASLTVTANDLTKTYGSLLTFDGTEFVVSGPLFFNDSIDSATLTSAGAAADAQSDRVANAGRPYVIDISEVEGSGLDNYDVTLRDGSLSVRPASLTVTANDLTKTYGSLLTFDGTEFVVSGPLFFNDSIDSATLTSAGAAADAQSDRVANAGRPYVIDISEVEGSGLDNYDVTLRDGSLSVRPASLTVTANDLTKTYGSLLTFDGTEFVVSGPLLFNDSIDSATLTSAGAAADAQSDRVANAGRPYVIDISEVEGGGLDNYDITLREGSLSVLPASLTVTANDLTKTVGHDLIFSGTEFTTRGLVVAGDSVDTAVLNSEGAPASANQEDSPFAIRISEVSGTRLGNYDVTLAEGALTVVDAEPVPFGDVPTPYNGFELPNPGDNIDFGAGSGTIAGVLGQSRSRAEATLFRVDLISDELEVSADACGQSSNDVGRYLACLSDSLNEFADELDALASDLPPGMRNVARIVQDARIRIDQARSRAQQRLAGASTDAERQAIRVAAVNEARAALSDASTEIRKAISLVRADDPELAAVQRATVTRVADAVDSVGIKMSRVVGL